MENETFTSFFSTLHDDPTLQTPPATELTIINTELNRRWHHAARKVQLPHRDGLCQLIFNFLMSMHPDTSLLFYDEERKWKATRVVLRRAGLGIVFNTTCSLAQSMNHLSMLIPAHSLRFKASPCFTSFKQAFSDPEGHFELPSNAHVSPSPQKVINHHGQEIFASGDVMLPSRAHKVFSFFSPSLFFLFTTSGVWQAFDSFPII